MNKIRVENGKMIDKQDNAEGCFYCDGLELTTLENSPDSVEEVFGCYNNNLITLKGCPQHIGVYCDASYNKDLEDISDLAPDCNEIFLVDCNKVKTFTTCLKGIDNTLWFRVKPEQEDLIQRIKQWPYYEVIKVYFDESLSDCLVVSVKIKPDNEVFMNSL